MTRGRELETSAVHQISESDAVIPGRGVETAAVDRSQALDDPLPVSLSYVKIRSDERQTVMALRSQTLDGRL